MPTIDHALAYDFIDPAAPTVPYRLEFHHPYRRDDDPHPARSNPAGQLVAVVRGGHPQRGATIPVSRAGVNFNPIETAVDRDHWPMLTPNQIDLSQIRQRIRAAGLA